MSSLTSGQYTLWVLTHYFKRSAFWFTVSFQRTNERPEVDIERSEDKKNQLCENFLLVEDNSFNQMVAQKLLESPGLKATLTDNGVEALAKLDAESFDLVLIDCQMPERGCFNATREIRQLVIRAQNDTLLPIIVMTANVMSGNRERCIKVGIDDYRQVRATRLC